MLWRRLLFLQMFAVRPPAPSAACSLQKAESKIHRDAEAKMSLAQKKLLRALQKRLKDIVHEVSLCPMVPKVTVSG